MKKKMGISFTAAIVSICVLGFGGGFIRWAVTENPNRITVEEFSQLEIGMTLDECSSLVGSRPSLSSMTTTANGISKKCLWPKAWSNPHRRPVIVYFVDDILHEAKWQSRH
jgi:hypothetical protein